jgi:hypothetical protein
MALAHALGSMENVGMSSCMLAVQVNDLWGLLLTCAADDGAENVGTARYCSWGPAQGWRCIKYGGPTPVRPSGLGRVMRPERVASPFITAARAGRAL